MEYLYLGLIKNIMTTKKAIEKNVVSKLDIWIKQNSLCGQIAITNTKTPGPFLT